MLGWLQTAKAPLLLESSPVMPKRKEPFHTELLGLVLLGMWNHEEPFRRAANYESGRLCSSLVFKVLLKISPWPPKCSLKKLFTSSSLSLSVCCADHDFIFLEIGNAKEKYENSAETHQQYLCHYSVIIPSLSSKKSVWEAECPELEGLLQRHYNVCSTITKSIKTKTKVSFFVVVVV